jgi:hypothetical protein
VKCFVVILLFLFSAAIFAQTPDTLWKKTFGHNLSDIGNSVQQTADGGYIIAGTTQSLSAIGLYDIWLIKTDANGDSLWTKTFGDSLGDWGQSVQQTTDGGYIIVGNTHRWGYNSDILLIRTDGNGDTIWTKTFGDSLTDYGFSVQQTQEGGYVITGSTHGDGRVWLIRTDDNGDTLWNKTYGDSFRNWGNSVQQTTDGGFIITGLANYFEGGYLFLIRTDTNGDTLWTKILGERGSGGTSVQETSDEGYIITGYRGDDIWLIKADANGDTLWTKILGFGSGHSIQKTFDGGYIITGYWGWLIKTDANGDKLWTKTLWGEGTSAKQTFEGGYIIAGTTSEPGGDDNVLLIKIASDITSIDAKSQVYVNGYQLKQNYPNPFNPSTTISFQVLQNSGVQIDIFNTLGQKVRTLLNDRREPGFYQMIWDGRNDSGVQVGSGVYLYRMVAGDFVQVRKMILMK